MLEALWSMEFASNVGGAGAGMVVLETGRVLGGDPSFTVIGSYKMTPQGVVEVKVRVKRFRADPRYQSIFGAGFDDLELQLAGRPERESFDLQGSVVGAPARQVKVRLVRRGELP